MFLLQSQFVTPGVYQTIRSPWLLFGELGFTSQEVRTTTDYVQSFTVTLGIQRKF